MAATGPTGNSGALFATSNLTSHIAVTDLEGGCAAHVHTNDTCHILIRTDCLALKAQSVKGNRTATIGTAYDTEEGSTAQLGVLYSEVLDRSTATDCTEQTNVTIENVAAHACIEINTLRHSEVADNMTLAIKRTCIEVGLVADRSEVYTTQINVGHKNCLGVRFTATYNVAILNKTLSCENLIYTVYQSNRSLRIAISITYLIYYTMSAVQYRMSILTQSLEPDG